MTAPPFPYFGGKQILATRIAAAFPPHGHYVEPFAGSLAVLLAKPPSPFETVNDLDGDVMTFWRVLRDQPDDLTRVCALTPHSRGEFEAARDRPHDLTDLERARRVWVYLTQGRGGILRNTGWRHYKKPSGTTSVPAYLRGYVARIHPALERLQRVSLECRPALEVITEYGQHPDVLLYVDPPYLGSTRGWGANYQVEMRGAVEHLEVLDALQGVPGGRRAVGVSVTALRRRPHRVGSSRVRRRDRTVHARGVAEPHRGAVVEPPDRRPDRPVRARRRVVIGPKLCECGCRQPAPIAKKTNTRDIRAGRIGGR